MKVEKTGERDKLSGFFVFFTRGKMPNFISKVKINTMLKKIFKYTFIAALGFAGCLLAFYFYLANQKGKPADDFKVFQKQNERKTLVIAHRGGKAIAPENTIEAFEKARELGVDVLELDIRATKDGEFVVIHDEEVDRTTNGKGLVADFTLEEIQKLDAGYKWTNDDGRTFPFRNKNVRIPTLREVFEKFPDITINIEPKHTEPSPTEPLCRIVSEFDRKDSIIVGSFNKVILKDFRKNCPGIATSASPSEVSNFLGMYKVGLTANYHPKMQALQIPPQLANIQVVDKQFVEAAHKQNLAVHVWTINEVEEMKYLIDIGVDGIMTDYPDRLIELLGEE